MIRNKKPAKINIAIDQDPEVKERFCKIFESQGIIFYRTDALNYLSGLHPAEDTLIYADPPYLMETRKSGKLYRYEYTEQQHVDLLKQLVSLRPAMVMISGYRSALYDEMLAGWNLISFEVMTRGGMATEWVWFNFPEPTELHDYSFLGETFRDRERITRKQKRWIANLKRMSGLERNALIRRIGEEIP